MKILSTLLLYIYLSAFDKQLTHYEVECGASAQWLNGKKSCSIYDESMFLTTYDEANFKKFTVFKVKLQNIGTDTIQVLPKDMYITRVYANGSMDSVSVCNPELYIQKADADIARCEKDINSIIKANNTENAAVNIVRSVPWGNKINTNTGPSNTIYAEKLRSAQNALLDAKAEKAMWESQALRANTIQPMSFIEGDIYFEANNSIKMILHIKLNNKNFDFLINQVSE
jgi:hypothetical protein